ncbi:pyrimidine reductase family protein [Micromonospora endolithica]|uniref:Pyrimidine reductase family protein n=1 Tax=Micromonospora endolithica TaxID=230091 RepID=A0A3A9ZL71_9ACTN|nr:pyrimidine reductase family protein [Micromonospora endolithica]RKN49100.1 pyrimidine reductase family protein [Micromonospora endolithica]TWJ23251.1 riboflavin biosynthesis pyrimidine reductase [Micromonospora endolithica]
MTVGIPISRLWPDPVAEPLDDAALTALYRRADRPHLRMNFVASVDGAVTVDGYSAGLSGEPDKRVFGLLRMLCDALVVAAGTLRHEDYRAVRLSPRRRAWRREHGLAEYPTLVVVSGSLDLDPGQAAFADAPVRPVVLTHARATAPPGLVDVADVVPVGDDRVDLAAGLAELHRRGLGQVLCEGGPHLFGALTGSDLVDEVCLTVAPLLAGPGPGRITAGEAAAVRHLSLRHVLATADGVLMLRYARA